MKICKICNQQYADNLEQCPYCVENGKNILKKLVMPVIIILAIIILPVIVSIATKKDPNIISIASMGENYPYTIDNVRIQCAADYLAAVYIVDKSGNKYAINGSANQYLTKIKPDKKYKGYTSNILKNGMTDAQILQIGLKICED